MSQFNEYLRQLLALPREKQELVEARLKQESPEGYKKLNLYLKSHPGALHEAQGYEHLLRRLGQQTFTRPFAPIQHRFWEWNWNALQKVQDKEPLEPREKVGFLPWPRETGKSTNIEWACILEGALLQLGYVIYLSGKLSQAVDHVAAIRDRIESNKIAELYPWLGKPKLGTHGNKFGWGQEFLITSGGWAIRPVGADVAMRGGKAINIRPTLIVCHQRGTLIFEDGKWFRVEDHPSAQSRYSNGYEVKLWGIPSGEIVTPEHRYWTKEYVPRAKGDDNYVEGGTGWKEASGLHNHCWIGLPIDTVIENPLALSVFHYASKERQTNGTFYGPAKHSVFREEIPIEFNDPDWWWLFGYWWGDGHRTKTQIGLTIANKDVYVRRRIESLLGRYEKPFTVFPKDGCVQLVFAATTLSRWLKTWRVGNSRKQPPFWVERLPLEYQRQLIRGYVDADGYVDKPMNCVRLTSIHLDGLLCVRRILARLGVAASIRRGAGPRLETFKNGQCWSQQKYDLRFQDGAAQFGFDIKDGYRYKLRKTFVRDGFLWTKVRSLNPVSIAEFIPIKTTNGTYQTHFGLSHNCDDYDELDDSPHVVEHKEHMLTRAILPMGDANTRVLVPQNPIHANSVVNRMLTGVSLALAIRTVFGEINEDGSLSSRPIPAVRGLVYEVRQSDEGPYCEITQGESNWNGISVDDWAATLNRVGPEAFKAEYQHDMTVAQEERVLPEYDDRLLRLHVITWSQYEAKYRMRRIPSDWPCDAGLDIGYSGSHKSAWTFLAKVPQAYELAGSIFRYRGRTFTGVGIDEQAVTIRSELWPDEQIQREFMSHEKLGERLVLAQKHNWHFQPCDSAKTAGIAQWRHFLRPDRSQPHPFHRDEKEINGLWRLGRPTWFDIVEDSQFYSPVDDKGLKRHRDGAFNWRQVPVKLTDKGLTVEQPAKMDDDENDSTRMLTAGFGPITVPLTQSQRVQQIIPAGYHKRELAATRHPNDAQMTGELAEWLAKRALKSGRLVLYDSFGQPLR